jgi:hypothetical protein
MGHTTACLPTHVLMVAEQFVVFSFYLKKKKLLTFTGKLAETDIFSSLLEKICGLMNRTQESARQTVLVLQKGVQWTKV